MTIAERIKAKATKAVAKSDKKPATAKPATPKATPVRNRTVDRELIVINPKLQCRQSMSEQVVDEYHQLIKDGVKMPPLRCVDIGGELHLVDGFTRFAALTRAGKTRVDIAVSAGTHDDAVREACGANRTHGMRRTTADIKKAVTLAEETFKGISRKAIAELIGVSVRSVFNHTEAPKKETKPKKEPKEEQKATTPAASVTVPKRLKQESKPKKEPKATKTVVVGNVGVDVDDEVDVKSGDPCVSCGTSDWVLTDGGWQCKGCNQPIEQNNPAEKKLDKSKIDTALGKLVREVEEAGLYSELKELLDAFAAKLVNL